MKRGEAFGRKLRHFVVDDRGVFGQRIANAELRMADEPDDISGVRRVYRFPIS